MNIIDVIFTNRGMINLVVELILVTLICILCFMLKRHYYFDKNRFKPSEVTINIPHIGSVTFKNNDKVQEIAYKIWIELITRKIALIYDESNDVIIEVFNSWYNAFGIIREIIKEIPGSSIYSANQIIKITIKVLNSGLRPCLTKWQAKFRRWYDNELKK